jgi:hypothetical protein
LAFKVWLSKGRIEKWQTEEEEKLDRRESWRSEEEDFDMDVKE